MRPPAVPLALLALLLALEIGALELISLVGGSSDTASLALGALVVQIFFAALAIGGAAFSKRPFAERLGLVRGRLPLGSAAALVLGMLATSYAIDAALDLTGLRRESVLADLEREIASARGGGLALITLGIGIAPGIAEELLCRGLVQRGLSSRLGAAGSIAVAALFFAALHAEPVHAAAALPLGVYLGLVAQLADSVWPAIACHIANNTFAVLTTSSGLAALDPSPASIAAGGAVAALALVVAWRAPRRAPAPAPSAAAE